MARLRRHRKRGRRRLKRGIVDFLTNPKVIQAFLTGSTFAVLNKTVEVVSIRTVSLTPVPMNPGPLSIVLMAGLATWWYWVDRHTEEFMELVEDVSGEEVPEENKEAAEEESEG